MSKIGILGTGTWGTALGRMLANMGHSVVMWSAIEKEIDDLSSTRTHPNLPGMTIPSQIQFTKNIEVACEDKDVLIFAFVFVQRQVKRELLFRMIRLLLMLVRVSKRIPC